MTLTASTRMLRPALGLVMAALTVAACQSTSPTAGGQARNDRRADVSVARQLQMENLEYEMNAIELALARRGRVDLADLKRRAYSINTALLAFPHLFPPDTKPVVAADGTRTPAGSIASPAVWTDNGAFYAMAQASAKPAYDASQARNLNQYRAAMKEMRNACDSCHARFMDEAALKAGYKPPGK